MGGSARPETLSFQWLSLRLESDRTAYGSDSVSPLLQGSIWRQVRQPLVSARVYIGPSRLASAATTKDVNTTRAAVVKTALNIGTP